MAFIQLPIIKQIFEGMKNESGTGTKLATTSTTTAKVTNQQILDALAALGMPGVSTLSTYGAQSKEFRQRLIGAGIHEALIDAAISIARGEEPDVNALEARLTTDNYMAPPALIGATGMPASDTGNVLAGARKAPPAPTPMPAPLPSSLSGGEQTAPPAYQSVPSLPAAKALTPAELRSQLEANYGWAAALADEPEIQRILTDYSNGQISDTEVLNRFRSTDYYKTTTETERSWRILQRTDPAEAAAVHSAQRDNLLALSKKLGINVDGERLTHLTDVSLRYGWNDAQVQRFLAAEIRFDPTGAQTGVIKGLQDQARDFLVPLSDQTLTSWAQSIVSGTKTAEDYAAYLRQTATSMFPALATALQDPNITVRQYLEPYAQTIGKTLGTNAADIDWNDPKYQRFVNQIDPKTNQRTVMTLADTQRTLMADPQYGWDQTAQGQATKAELSRGLLQTLGFAS